MTPWLGVSTGRAGSRFIAAVFNDVGIRCTHEKWVTWSQHLPDRVAGGEWTAAGPLYSDQWAGPVLWQLRAPAAVLASLDANRTFTDRRAFLTCLRNAGVDVSGVPSRDAVTYVTEWWRRCDAMCDIWWRVEDVTSPDVVGIAELIGRTVDPVAVSDALTRRRGLGQSVRRSPQPIPEWASELADLSERFGYARTGLPVG